MKSPYKILPYKNQKALFKPSRKENQFSWKLNSWGFDLNVIQEAENLGVEILEIVDFSENKRYLSTLEILNQMGFERVLSPKFGPQRFLPLKFWQIENLQKD